jgi:hypothetical protein
MVMNSNSFLGADEQKDEAKAHAANSTTHTLSEFFGGRVIYLNLCPLDPWIYRYWVCLWEFLTENVYKTN